MNQEIITSQFATIAHSAIGFLLLTIVAFLIALYFDKKRFIKFTKWGLVLASLVSIFALLYGKYAGLPAGAIGPDNKSLVKLYSEHQVWSNITFLTLLLISAWGFFSLKSKYTLPLLFYLFCAIAIAQLGLNGKVGYELLTKLEMAHLDNSEVFVKKVTAPGEKSSEKKSDKTKVVAPKKAKTPVKAEKVVTKKEPAKPVKALAKKDPLPAKAPEKPNNADTKVVTKKDSKPATKPTVATKTPDVKALATKPKLTKTLATKPQATKSVAQPNNAIDKSKLVMHPGATTQNKPAPSKDNVVADKKTVKKPIENTKSVSTSKTVDNIDSISMPDLGAIKKESFDAAKAASIKPAKFKPYKKLSKKPVVTKTSTKASAGKTKLPVDSASKPAIKTKTSKKLVKKTIKKTKKPASSEPALLSLDDLKKQISSEQNQGNETNQAELRKKKISKAASNKTTDSQEKADSKTKTATPNKKTAI